MRGKMKFDRTAPGGGVEVYCTLQPGKAFLEWKFYVTGCIKGEERDALIKVFVYGRDGNLILEGMQFAQEEELLKSVLLYPHLWRSSEDPYLYRAEIFLVGETGQEDSLSLRIPIRCFRKIQGKGWFLNEEPFRQKAVRYDKNTKEMSEECIRRELTCFLDAGANTICIREPHKQSLIFYELCEELGLVVWTQGSLGEVNGELFKSGGLATQLFYFYKACWSREPFVYIDSQSLRKERDGNFCITVYSNQEKVALYIDGTLFEILQSSTEFVFREIPFRTLFLCLTAEAGKCTMSVSVHKTFTKTSLFHDNYPLECTS
nr:hypothetical protein [uncultured Acetatifactor sp.]